MIEEAVGGQLATIFLLQSNNCSAFTFSAPKAACEPSLAEELRVNQGKKTNMCTGLLRALMRYV